MKTQIIAAFPGTGKTHFVASITNGNTAVDLDTNIYTLDYDENGRVNNKEFPKNYFRAIKQAIGQADYLFVGCQPEVLNMLRKEDLSFVLVYPERKLKDEYIRRFNKRGSSQNFGNLIKDNWDQFINFLEMQDSEQIILKSDQYISDVIGK